MYRDSLFYLNFTEKSRNVQISLLSRPSHSIKVICPENCQKKFRMAKNGCSEFSDNFSQKDWYNSGMAKNGCSKFFLTIFSKMTGINLEWPKMAVPNFFQQFFPKRQV